jgi:death-on-curing protein
VDEPRFLTLKEVLYLHDDSLVRFGGSRGIGDVGLVESALGAAQNEFWYGRGDLYQIAAAYGFHLAEAQAFVDANKRTGVAAALTFLKVNGIRVPEDDGSIYQPLIDISNKRKDKARLPSFFASWLKRSGKITIWFQNCLNQNEHNPLGCLPRPSSRARPHQSLQGLLGRQSPRGG